VLLKIAVVIVARETEIDAWLLGLVLNESSLIIYMNTHLIVDYVTTYWRLELFTNLGNLFFVVETVENRRPLYLVALLFVNDVCKAHQI
jgi:hypothetical protein